MKIDYDVHMNRHYIPLPGGWEVQTKGNGSTFRISDKTRNERMPIPLPDRILDFLERMARDIHAASPSTTLAACYTEAMNLSQTEFVHIKPEYRALQEAATKACVNEPGLAFPVYLMMRGFWNDASMWAEKPETNWMDDDGSLEVHEALDARPVAGDSDLSNDGESTSGFGTVSP